ncbi:MAG TPA: hypothetical protein VE777_02640 [Gaiellales bacterium]|jgi:hypothetical protein|nr:hypothetical protein [Gaiellales bacterium]
MRLRIVACAALLAGACAGGHQAHPAGVYEARVTTGHGPVQVVWLDRASGRFRVRTVQGPAQGAHRFGTVTVFDGSRATTAFRGGITRYVGSAAFVADEARPAAVDVLEQRLQGAPAPRGDTVTILRRSATAPPGLFQLGTGRVWGTVREVRPGRRVSGAGPQYWLGPTWSGRPPRYASVSTFSSGAEYSVTYPGISVDAGRRLGAPCAGTRVTLSDGTQASVATLPIGAGAAFRCSTATKTGSSVSSVGLDVFAVEGVHTKTLVLVTTPDATITLAGTGVTPATATSIARALRPV